MGLELDNVTAVWRTRHICSPESAWSHHNRPIAEFRDNFISSPQHSPMSCSPESPGHFISSQPLHTRFPPISKAWWSANLYNKEIELNEACFPHYAQLGLMFNCETCDFWNCPGQEIQDTFKSDKREILWLKRGGNKYCIIERISVISHLYFLLIIGYSRHKAALNMDWAGPGETETSSWVRNTLDPLDTFCELF